MHEPASRRFGHDTTADDVLDGIDLVGKLALVTGATSGLGAETVRALASKGARVVMTARNLEQGEEIARGIRETAGNDAIAVEELELGSRRSIDRFAERFLGKHDSLQILINNAGVMACPLTRTEDGFETQFGTNHLGHFLMTGSIAPALLAGAPARVVSLSSRGHQISPVVFDDVNYTAREYEKWAAYGQSKTANSLFAVELDRRLGSRGVHAYAVHPGMIGTNLSRHMNKEDYDFILSRAPDGPMSFKSVEAGAATSVYAATAPELEGRGGVYLEDCHIAEVDDSDGAAGGVRSYAVDPEIARRLWSVSEEMLGRTFDL